MTQKIHTLIPAAGIGMRAISSDQTNDEICEGDLSALNDLPKQYRCIAGQPMLYRTVEALLQDNRVSDIYIAVSDQDTWIDDLDFSSLCVMSSSYIHILRTGGDTRAETVYRSLQVLPAQPEDWILVHDAARPALPKQDLACLIDTAFSLSSACILATPSVDTLKCLEPNTAPSFLSKVLHRSAYQTDELPQSVGMIDSTVDRTKIWQAQTPQIAMYADLMRGFEQADLSKVTDEASLLEGIQSVHIVQGQKINQKVTYSEDFEYMDWWFSRAKDIV